MEDITVATDETTTATGASADSGGKGRRIDWRSGKPMEQRDDAFWREHERRRVEQGLSVRQYCQANDLALSTYRLRVGGRQRAATRAPAHALPAKAATFVAVGGTPDEATLSVEVKLAEGLSVCLKGAAAQRVFERVLERLA